MEEKLRALEQLGRLRDQKVLSQEEFDTEKARILAIEQPLHSISKKFSLKDLVVQFKRKQVWIPAAILTAVGIGAYLGLGAGVPSMTKDTKLVVSAAPTEKEAARLSSILKFENPQECTPGSDLAALFADMRALEANGNNQSVTTGLNGPTLVPEVTRAQQGNGVVSRLSISGVLEGLRVTELRTTRFDGSDAEFLQIRFAESPERVRSKLNNAGFAIPNVGETTSTDLSNDRGLVYGVEKIDNATTALTCAVL